ncbi:uncharacterized protein LOC117315832 [Pecten maximus]|uniref:uncharacterized protein LOC117315832 n=1 Tax=Pecten maximus TaxID=6579 RepID=UPI001458677E|nr:uncharacterized protein LOC117315832 [Pecten maximus]
MDSSLHKGQFPFRVKGQTTCMQHKGIQLEFYCEECEQLACIKCLSTVHKRHSLAGLAEITPQRKQDIYNFIVKTEDVDLVQVDQYITSTDTQLKENASSFDKLCDQIKSQNEKLKEELDLLSAHSLSLYKQMGEENTKLLQTYKQDMEMYRTQLKQKVKECKKALQQNSVIEIHDARFEIGCPIKFPVKPTIGLVSFSPNKYPQIALEKALGEVVISDQVLNHDLLDHGQSVSSFVRQGPSFKQRPEHNVNSEQRSGDITERSKDKKEAVRTTLLPQTKILREWNSPCDISSVCPTANGTVWTSYYFSETLTLQDGKGDVIQKVQHKTINDLSLSPITNTLWLSDEENSILEFKSGRLLHRFNTDRRPRCICITASNHVIVGMTNCISKFTSEGKLSRTTLPTGTEESLICTPLRITECSVTQNISVVDSKGNSDDDERNKYVVAIDAEFKKLFVFYGKISDTCQQMSQPGDSPFDPRGLAYDHTGNLVIGDHSNKRVLLISGRGEFLRILHTDTNGTVDVSIDKFGDLWAVFGLNNIKLLQYYSV